MIVIFYRKIVVRCFVNLAPVSEVVRLHHLIFFGYLAHTAPVEDHNRIIATTLHPPADSRRPAGRPRTTWLRTVDEDVQPQNFQVYIAWRKAKDRDIWRQVISMAMLWQEFAKKKKKQVRTKHVIICICTGDAVNWTGGISRTPICCQYHIGTVSKCKF